MRFASGSFVPRRDVVVARDGEGGSPASRGGHMKAARIRRFGPPSEITTDDLPRPEAGAGQVLVRVKAAGGGNWDALIRAGKVKLESPPIILGSELSGIGEGIGGGVRVFEVGHQVCGVSCGQ